MAKLNQAVHLGQTEHWEAIKRFDSEEGNVAKFVFEKELSNNGKRPAVVEVVLYKYPTYEQRTVICCSSQSGCPVGCRFCGAGDFFVRSLDDMEIVDQVAYALDQTKINPVEIKNLQIMFMSMGEPALNQNAICSAIETLNTRYPNAKLLISTSAPDVAFDKIFAVSKKVNKVGLQFSVHESTDEARAKLIPTKTMNLAQIAATGEAWHMETGRKPFFNYCTHDNNSSEEDAKRLRSYFDPAVWEATISVICERNEGLPARNDHQVELARNFSSLLLAEGYSVRVFDPAGQDDIGGGCGQLWYVQEAVVNNLIPAGKAKYSKGFGLPILHTPTKSEVHDYAD